MPNSNSITILDTLTNANIHDDPFSWGAWNSVLPVSLYSEVMDAYPTVRQVVGNRQYEHNARYDIDAAELFKRDDIDPRMKAFIQLHTSKEFWLKIVHVLGAQIREIYPDLEDRIGKPLEDFVVGIRNGKHIEEIDIELDAKPGYNTPPTKMSSVRGTHVDNPHELFAALLYCRDPADESAGGDFVIDQAIHPSDKWKWHGKAELYPNHFVDHAKVRYSQNAACFFLNSLDAVHHVTPREVTLHPRRLMNFIAEVRKPLFAIPKKRFRTPNDSNENSTENVQRGEPEAAPRTYEGLGY